MQDYAGCVAIPIITGDNDRTDSSSHSNAPSFLFYVLSLYQFAARQPSFKFLLDKNKVKNGEVSLYLASSYLDGFIAVPSISGEKRILIFTR